MLFDAIKIGRRNLPQVFAAAVLAAVPLSAQTHGAVNICKIAGTGVSTGVLFNFNVTGWGKVVVSGTSAGPGCNAVVATGTVTVTETTPVGESVTAITVSSNAGV